MAASAPTNPFAPASAAGGEVAPGCAFGCSVQGCRTTSGLRSAISFPVLPAEPRDVIAMAMGGDDGGQLAGGLSP